MREDFPDDFDPCTTTTKGGIDYTYSSGGNN